MIDDVIEYPIVDDDGEVLATDDDERLEELERAMTVLIVEARYRREADQARERIRLLAVDGDPPISRDGWAATVARGKRGARKVNPHAVESNREALSAIGAGPSEVQCGSCGGTGVREVMPKVSDITAKEQRQRIARAGINPDTLLIEGAPAPLVVEVVPPPEETFRA